MASSSRANSLGVALIAVVLGGATASAHRHDEFLQAARIGIEGQRVTVALSLTAGSAVADDIIADLDRDRDGSLSGDEQRDYLAAVMRGMHLAVNGNPLKLSAGGSTFPELEAIRGGDAPIELQMVAALPSLSAGRHRLALNNAYRRDVGVYLTNALLPEDDRLTIIKQHRDPEQRSTTIEFVIESRSSAMVPLWLATPCAAAWLLVRRRSLTM